MIKNEIKALKDLLSWSDRIGSDEIYEISKIINSLEAKLNLDTFTSYAVDSNSHLYKHFLDDGQQNEYLTEPDSITEALSIILPSALEDEELDSELRIELRSWLDSYECKLGTTNILIIKGD